MANTMIKIAAGLICAALTFGEGYVGAWLADDKPEQQKPAKETADNK